MFDRQGRGMNNTPRLRTRASAFGLAALLPSVRLRAPVIHPIHRYSAATPQPAPRRPVPPEGRASEPVALDALVAEVVANHPARDRIDVDIPSAVTVEGLVATRAARAWGWRSSVRLLAATEVTQPSAIHRSAARR